MSSQCAIGMSRLQWTSHRCTTLVSFILVLVFTTSQTHADLLLRNVTTVAGQYGIGGSADGPIATATLSGPAAITPAYGGYVIADKELIRLLKDGNVSTLFGVTGNQGRISGNKSVARIGNPSSTLFMNDDGYVYFTEPSYNAIRRLNETHVEDFAGGTNGEFGFSDSVNGTLARFISPSCICYSSFDGSFYVTDTSNNALRKVSRSGQVTTASTTLNSPFYCTATVEDRVLVLNRPTSSTVGVVRYFIGNQTRYQWISSTAAIYVALGFDPASSRLFAVSANRVHELFISNGSFAVIAGVGTAYVDGPDPRFNYLNNMYVSSFRSIFLVAGPQGYVVRRLAFDPPPPLSVTITFDEPIIFPTDNITALNISVAELVRVVNAQLGTNGTTTVSPFTIVYNATTHQTSVVVLVPNATYTNTTQATLQSNTNYSTVVASLNQYYGLTQFYATIDALKLPFLAIEAGSTVPGNASTVRDLLEAEVRAALGYSYLFVDSPSWTINVMNSGNDSSWKYLLPASFQNTTTASILGNLTHSSLYTYSRSLYANDTIVKLPASVYPIPMNNATAVRDVRTLLQAAAQTQFGYSPVGVDDVVYNATDDTYYVKLYVPPSYSPSTNATTAALLSNTTWPTIESYVDGYYPVPYTMVFDSTKFPWSDATAVASIRALLSSEANRVLVGNASSTLIDVDRDLILNLTARTVTFNILVPNAMNTNASEVQRLQQALTTAPNAAAFQYMYQYYLPSTTLYSTSIAAVGLPVYSAALMKQLRLAIGDDLAAALNFTNVGANNSVPRYTNSTQLRNGNVVTFPFLIPPWLLNTTLTNTSIATLVRTTFDAVLRNMTIPDTFINIDGSTLPLTNATAMEQLRQALSEALRQAGNLTDQNVYLMPANQTNATNVQYTIFAPRGSVNGLNITQWISDYLTSITAVPNGTLSNFVGGYYTSFLNITLPYALVPWSNATTMNVVRPLVAQDARNALAAVTNSSDPVLVTSTSVSKDNRTVTFSLLVSPVYGGSNTASSRAALQASTLPITQQYLYDYFPKTLNVSMDSNALPWTDPVAMATIRNLLSDYLADNVFWYANVGINNSDTRNTTSGIITFKVIVPPPFDNATTAALLRTNTSGGWLLTPDDVPNMTGFLDNYFPQNYFITFANGTMPVNDSAAMATIRRLLQLDASDLFAYPVGVNPFQERTDNSTGVLTIAFPLLLPPSFDNGSTVNSLIGAHYPRLDAFLTAYYATPAPIPTFVYRSQWPIASLPSTNSTQMELLRQALLEDVLATLGLSPSDVNVTDWELSSDGNFADFPVILPSSANNATTGVLLQDPNNYPRFQALLALITQGNNVGFSPISSAIDEGCSQGCVIGVAATGAVVVTGAIVAAIVLTSKKKRTASVVAPKFSSVVVEDGLDDAEMPPAGESPSRQRGNKNPLDLP